MKDIWWRIINKIDLGLRYVYVLLTVKKADIVLTATSAQTNLGDHAISIAERSFFAHFFCGFKVVEIPKELYLRHRQTIKPRVNHNATVVVSGGGFLGDLWMTEEALVRSVLEDFTNNKVIVFPQTIFFSTNSDEYEKSFAIYRNAADLTMNARDKDSYDILVRELSKDVVYCIPDIVLSLDYQNDSEREDIALLCIRDDKENCLTKKEIESLTAMVKNRIDLKETTTIVDHIVPISFRKHYVMKKLNEIASARIVVTNRLHMMIFAAISGTPCIAIDNLSHKVSGAYQWIRSLPYIELIGNINDFPFALDKLMELGTGRYPKDMLGDYYRKLRNEFKVKTDVKA